MDRVNLDDHTTTPPFPTSVPRLPPFECEARLEGGKCRIVNIVESSMTDPLIRRAAPGFVVDRLLSCSNVLRWVNPACPLQQQCEGTTLLFGLKMRFRLKRLIPARRMGGMCVEWLAKRDEPAQITQGSP